MGARRGPLHLRLTSSRPSRALGVLVSIAGVAAATALIYPLKHAAPVISLGVLYLLGVVVVSSVWGLTFGVATGILSAAAFSFFHLPPVGRFTLADSRNWIALSAFVAVAVAMGLVAELARARAREAEERRGEADLARELAQLLLGAQTLAEALPLAARQLARAIGVERAAIELESGAPPEQGLAALELRDGGGGRIGTLLLPSGLSQAERARVSERIVPALESVLAAALHRAELQAEVVETAALRRSDEMKTAVLRSVSHDLRTPVTAILSAAETLDPDQLSRERVAEVRELVLDAATRLRLLIEKLLDLSQLQTGQLQPSSTACSIEEVLHEAVEQARAQGRKGSFSVSIEPELPLLRADPGQLERAFANVLENAVRYSAGTPVQVRARAVGGRLRVLVVDQGPGIHPAERERVFLPFYRSSQGPRGHHGSGLGLAIARGFVEVNGGRIAVESTPGQGTSVVVEFPLGLGDDAGAGASAVAPEGRAERAPAGAAGG
jgi:two-component system, OmpR family, sensor histidine kinase KdpD